MRAARAAACLALLMSMPVAGQAAGVPRGVHVALGADAARTATITWFTEGTDDPGTTVEYGHTDALGLVAAGTSKRAPGLPVTVHEVPLGELEPGGTVHYRAGGSSGFTPVRSFHTAPLGRAPFRFTVFSDHGIKEQSRRTTALALTEDADLHVMAGDLSYANGNQRTWDRWFNEIEPIASTRPLMAAIGNHENEPGLDTAAFRDRFALPGAELYYSFDYANVHFLVVQSDKVAWAQDDIVPGMVAFVESDLADAAARRDAGELDFIVVVQHHPLYGSMSAGVTDLGPVERQQNAGLIAVEEQWLHRYDVDLLISAHNHHYERTTPIRYGQAMAPAADEYTDPEGFVEVITGGGGESLYGFRDPNDVPPWSVERVRRYHYSLFEVDGQTMRMRAITTDDTVEVVDSWTLHAA